MDDPREFLRNLFAEEPEDQPEQPDSTAPTTADFLNNIFHSN